MAGKNVVVIGGGFGGAAAAIKARTLLGAGHAVTLVDRRREVNLCGMNPMLIAGQRDPRRTTRSLGVLGNRGINVVNAHVDEIDFSNHALRTGDGAIDYDYLVIAAGAEYDWDRTPGAADAYSFYDIASARRLRRRLSRMRRGHVSIGVASTPYKCPPAPFETSMILDWFFRQSGIRQDIEITVSTPEPGPMPVAGPDAMAMILRAFDRKGIQLKSEVSVSSVRSDGREVVYSDGSTAEVDVAVTIPHHIPASIVRDTSLIGPSGWVKVNPKTLETAEKDVFAIGDVNAVPMSNGKGVPKAGVFASAEGETVGHNIAAAINQSSPVEFPGDGYCFIGFGGETSASVIGNFLTEGKPDVHLTAPTARGMRSKERFERDWKRFRV
ncbi:MAG: NAD(P)/FAD-dependent oxidoreductase [Chloroflexi bacterium]|nr:NAD(P)/FAD-dependent oxidoreductase [Chloroflexota bacterium]